MVMPMHKLQRQSPDAVTRLVDYMFYHEKEIRRAVTRRKVCTGNDAEVLKIALSDGTSVVYPDRWLTVIEHTYRHLEGLAPCVREKYMRKDWKDIVTRLGISKDCYYNAVNEARTFAKCAACQLGIIRVIE